MNRKKCNIKGEKLLDLFITNEDYMMKVVRLTVLMSKYLQISHPKTASLTLNHNQNTISYMRHNEKCSPQELHRTFTQKKI